ncbi:MAG: hypothetical protein KR126chlam5_00233, partial [Candidatus Anoxychlamydiales bacterium]|nr:hypothetical protein [Candidatus Anoxychlamydiales bacterium]
SKALNFYRKHRATKPEDKRLDELMQWVIDKTGDLFDSFFSSLLENPSTSIDRLGGQDEIAQGIKTLISFSKVNNTDRFKRYSSDLIKMFTKRQTELLSLYYESDGKEYNALTLSKIKLYLAMNQIENARDELKRFIEASSSSSSSSSSSPSPSYSKKITIAKAKSAILKAFEETMQARKERLALAE